MRGGATRRVGAPGQQRCPCQTPTCTDPRGAPGRKGTRGLIFPGGVPGLPRGAHADPQQGLPGEQLSPGTLPAEKHSHGGEPPLGAGSYGRQTTDHAPEPEGGDRAKASAGRALVPSLSSETQAGGGGRGIESDTQGCDRGDQKLVGTSDRLDTAEECAGGWRQR